MYPKDKVFVKIYNKTGKKKTSIINEKPPLNTRFVEKCKNVNRLTLYRFNGPFEVLQADIPDI